MRSWTRCWTLGMRGSRSPMRSSGSTPPSRRSVPTGSPASGRMRPHAIQPGPDRLPRPAPPRSARASPYRPSMRCVIGASPECRSTGAHMAPAMSSTLIEGHGWPVNLYGVPDLEAFLEAALLLPASVTADFNSPSGTTTAEDPRRRSSPRPGDTSRCDAGASPVSRDLGAGLEHAARRTSARSPEPSRPRESSSDRFATMSIISADTEPPNSSISRCRNAGSG